MASIEGTRRFLARAVQRGALHAGNVRQLPLNAEQGLACAALGFGGYRVGGGPDASQHLQAMRAAIGAGVNLFDTSAHYSASKDGGHGESESLIGQAIAEAVAAEEASRDELIVCTKVGHVARGVDPSPPESTPCSPDGGLDDWHSIHPDFIHSEVRASKDRLGTAPDVVLLHNPEYLLSTQLREQVEIGVAWDEMYRRLQASFVALEQLCDDGIIGSGYGVSGNFLSCIFSTTGRPNLYEALSIDRVLEAAELAAAAAGKQRHRLQVIQVPLNAVESGAVLGRGKAVPHAEEGDALVAERNGVAVVANRPLNTLPLPGVSSGDWGRGGQSHIRLKDSKPLSPVHALLKRVLLEGAGARAQVAPDLQRLALRLSASAPGVSCSLCGMRRVDYVQDVAAVLQEPPLPKEQVAETMKTVRQLMQELGAEHRRFWS
mmetsp:Transcript_65395/g.156370  ORF Transcript_65395/g.156370 Transcript_65395/m.156370 type:complete len:433 (-) Transcript_65395:213-1511(-)